MRDGFFECWGMPFQIMGKSAVVSDGEIIAAGQGSDYIQGHKSPSATGDEGHNHECLSALRCSSHPTYGGDLVLNHEGGIALEYQR